MGHKRTRNKAKLPGYAPAIIRLGLSGVCKPGEVTHVSILHDDWCDQL
jgi:hypothetical protein